MNEPGEKPILVCGLGRLGQRCAATLAEVGAPLHGIALAEPPRWSVVGVREKLASFTAGDFRVGETLAGAHVEQCRAVLFLASDERANIAGAFAARRLNASVRIVIRSAQHDLNALLAAQLGNFVAFEPMRLAAPAFALAALGDETVGLFRVHDRILRIRRHVASDRPPGATWIGRGAGEIATPNRRVLGCRPRFEPARPFHDWTPEQVVASGDVVTVVELADDGAPFDRTAPAGDPRDAFSSADAPARPPPWVRARAFVAEAWRGSTPTQRVVLAAMGAILALFVSCVVLYDAVYPDLTLRDAVNVASVLVLGGYDNLFGQLHLPFAIPWWLHVFSFALTAAGTVGTGIVYGFIIDRIVAWRLQAPWQRARVPARRHVILVGADRLAGETASLLRRLRCAVVTAGDSGHVGSGVPHVAGPPREALRRARLGTARSVLVVTDDEVANLEIALTVRRDAPRSALVLRADDSGFSDNVARLVPDLRAIGVYAPAAEAFAAAALGENVHGLSHVDEQTVLLVEYEVESGDTLDGSLLGEIAYGYGIVPVLYARPGKPYEPFPSDDHRLQVGDRVVVVATIDGLRGVERGRVQPATCHVQVESVPAGDSAFDGAMAIARVTGCKVAEAQAAMRELPGRLGIALYPHQARRLVRELSKARVVARIEVP